jgi:hypothetical protein
MKALPAIYEFWKGHGTKLIGLAQGTIAAVEGVTEIMPDAQLKYWLGASAVLTFWSSFSSTARRQTSDSGSGLPPAVLEASAGADHLCGRMDRDPSLWRETLHAGLPTGRQRERESACGVTDQVRRTG